MKNNNFKNIIVLTVIASIVMLSCKKDNNNNKGTPEYKIAASEKLVIPAAIDLPANLPGGNSRLATYYAEGVQKYKAQLKPGSTNEYEWVFVAPEANLYNASNTKVGTHGAGPYWTIAASDSIFAQHYTPQKTVTPDANSIAWLQLIPKEGKTASGIFSNVFYIQRIATTGGKAPPAAPQSLSDTASVFYTAIYRFSKKN
ncbi:MAG: DUF3455 domain-containing protein [Ferruginibacter sp.]|nr:DUF3455 domain-containing protein [Ferruginibacter sp.]